MADQPSLSALDLYVSGQNVGRLARDAEGDHVFTYRSDTPENLFVSLTMPVRLKSYVTHQLQPIFQMNLPEGYQRELLRQKFGRLLADTELGLLGLVGARGIGRVQAVPAGQQLPPHGGHVDVEALLSSREAQAQLLSLIEQNVEESVSGVMPKVLLRADERVTTTSGDWILKTAGADFAAITQNEYFCLLAARNSRMSVPEFKLSGDRRVLAVKRFDIERDLRLGFEDMAVLQGLGTAEKYSGTWERIVRSVEDYFLPEARQPARRKLFKMLAFSLATRNDDAHLKNFGVLYSNRADIHLAPVYDVVTTLAYDEMRTNLPALSFLGKKTWTPGMLVWRFGRNTCKLSDADIQNVFDEIRAGLTQTAELVGEAARNDDDFREVGKRMIRLWAEGAGSLTDRKTGLPIPEIAAASDRHKLSDPKPAKPKRNPYKGVDGPVSSKVR